MGMVLLCYYVGNKFMFFETEPPPGIVRNLAQFKRPPVPGLIVESENENEGVSQTHLVIDLSGLEPFVDPGDDGGVFQLKQINFCDWQGRRLREEVLRGNQVTFGLNHDNLVFVYREDRRYKPSLSEEIRHELLAVVALLGSGTNVPERAEAWPLLPESEGSYCDGELIVLAREDAERVLDVQEELIVENNGEKTEDIGKEAIRRVVNEF